MNHTPDAERAVSEMLGTVILIGVITVAFAIIAVVVFSAPPPQHVPSLNAEISSNAQAVQIQHNGGDTFSMADIQILVDGQDLTSSFKVDGTAPTTWAVGQELTYDLPPGASPPNSIQIVFSGAGTSQVIAAIGQGSTGTISASSPRVTAITPNSGAVGSTVNITSLTGSNFISGATVKLSRYGSSDIPASNVVVVSNTQITCTFDLNGQTPGGITWDVVVTNPDGSPGTLSRGFSLVAAIPPVVNFSATPVSGKVPLTVAFTDETINYPESWDWRFGDGNYSLIQNPTHTYEIPGTYNVTLTVTNEAGSGNLTKVNYITVIPLQVFTINATASPSTGGTITPSGRVNVTEGTSQRFDISSLTGYALSDVLIDSVSNGAILNYTFSNVAANHTITAVFLPTQVTITATAGPNGNISPSGATPVTYGTNQTFSMTAITGYHVSDVQVDNVSAGAVTTYQFTNVTANRAINANFTINQYNITPSILGGNGAVSPAVVQTANYGDTPTFMFIPATGYHLFNVTVDGLAVTPTGNNYTFPAVSADHTIVGSFAINQYTVGLVNQTGHGTISPSSNFTMNYGDTPTITFTPDYGYHLDTVTVNGTPVIPTGNSYTFSAVTMNQTLVATFAINQYTIGLVNQTGHGTISPSSNFTVNYLDAPTITFSPDYGYHLGTVTVNGTVVTPTGNSYTFPAVATNQTLVAAFVVNQYTVGLVNQTGHGTISPSSNFTVNYGAAPVVNFTPDYGYHLGTVTVNGTVVTPTGNSYTFPAVATNQTLVASFVINQYTIGLVNQTGHGTISPSSNFTVNYGAIPVVNFTPDYGYHLGTVTVNGTVVTPTGNSYTFPAVATNQTLVASFVVNQYTIGLVNQTGHGTISPSSNFTVNYGATPVVNFTPNTGYHLGTVTVNGTVVTPTGNSYTFPAVATNQTLVASFVVNQYTIGLVNLTGSGTISPSSNFTVNYGATPIVNFTANTGYHLQNVTVNGTLVTPVSNSYTFPAVATNQTLVAAFAINQYTITPSILGGHGNVSPNSTFTVNYGATPIVNFTANAGYHLFNVTVNGTVVTPTGNSYTFPAVTTNNTIVGSFLIDPPVANFTANILTGPLPLTVQFTDLSNNTPTGWTWNFGDGNYSSLQNPTNTYSTAGNYSVSLTASNAGGSNYTIKQGYIFTYVPVVADFTANNTIGTATLLTVHFTDSSTGGPLFWNWDFGDAFTLNQTLSGDADHSYSVENTTNYLPVYTSVNLSVANSYSSDYLLRPNYITVLPRPPSVIVSANPASGYAPLTVVFNSTTNRNVSSYEWYFADGTLNATTRNTTHTFSNPGQYNVSLTATNAGGSTVKYKLIDVTGLAINATWGANGNITPGNTTVPYGSNQTFTITPIAGYHVANVLVDLVSQGAVTSYTFTTVTAPHNISATFAVNTYNLNVTAGTNGAISPGNTTVNYLGFQNFTITPVSGYRINTLSVDGVVIDTYPPAIPGYYNFTDVTANHNMSATFAADAPTFVSITPSTGPNSTAKITPITIRGTNLIGATTGVPYNVTIGGTRMSNLTVVNSTMIVGSTPAHPDVGWVDVVITTPNGTVTATNAYRYYFIHKFTIVGGNTSVVPTGATVVDYLVVGGGGGGGRLGGGGGAGGLLHGTGISVTPGTQFRVAVGAGGVGGASGTQGRIGYNSSFANTTVGNGYNAKGGGGGGTNSGTASITLGINGGSGGGGAVRTNTAHTVGTAGTGISGQGNNGGVGAYSSRYYGGGGGGAGGLGGTLSGSTAGAGGIGASDVSDLLIAADAGVDIGGIHYIAGGGGGGAASGATAGGSGGSGGGGAGSLNTATPGAGTANTGGGGGASGATGTAGAAGGSGIVILKYY